MTDVAEPKGATAHDASELEQRLGRARAGGSEKARAKLREQNKLMARERIALLFDEGAAFVEDGLLANNLAPATFPRTAWSPGSARSGGRACAVMANDPSVKAGSWGARTVEKIVRILETAERLQIPMVYLVDSAGARITDQVAMFPGRRHAGRIFRMQVRLSGQVPQLCVLFGPSAAGRRVHPRLLRRGDHGGGQRLDVPRLARAWPRWWWGRRSRSRRWAGRACTAASAAAATSSSRTRPRRSPRRGGYMSYMPSSWREPVAVAGAVASADDAPSIEATIPTEPGRGYDVQDVIRALVDAGSFFEIKRLFARELVTGFARIDGRAIGVIASQPRFKGGVLFVDSADKAARFITCCDAFNIPLLFLADVPGFMIGTAVERQGIIRHGAKMIAALTQASVPKICVVMRKAYGAGLYAMCGPAFDPDCTLALPSAQIAVMGPEAAVNAVYYNRIHELPEEERARLRGTPPGRVPRGHRHLPPGRRADRRRRGRAVGAQRRAGAPLRRLLLAPARRRAPPPRQLPDVGEGGTGFPPWAPPSSAESAPAG